MTDPFQEFIQTAINAVNDTKLSQVVTFEEMSDHTVLTAANAKLEVRPYGIRLLDINNKELTDFVEDQEDLETLIRYHFYGVE